MIHQVLERKPLLCKYCQKVEITFSKGRVSKAGRMIPLNANSLEPHKCIQNPYYQQQSTSASKGLRASSAGPDNNEQEIEIELKQDILNEILYNVMELRREVKSLVSKS
jgi:hypothetical protein